MSSVKTYVTLLVLVIACSAQSSTSFDEEYSRGIEQNPLGITFTISTIPAYSAWHLSDFIRFRMALKSMKARIYTAEIAGGGSSAGASFDFIIQGPGWHRSIRSPAIPLGSFAAVANVGISGRSFSMDLNFVSV